MADFPDVYFSSIAEINSALRAKQFSCVELTRAFCDRLERFGPRYNALALSLRDQAIRQARNVDDELKRGRTRGALQGVPYGVKDLLAAKGQPTAWGAKPYASQVFDRDAAVVEKLNAVGAILIGKLSMVQLAGGGGYRYAAASANGPGRNPWDTGRWSGGSSSGPGSATAAGLVTFSIGSETSGSILTPAAYCGVTGLRPTYGLVSRRGAMALSWTLDKLGPMCRSAEDCGLVLQTVAGNDSEDPGSAGRGFRYTPQFAKKPQDLRVGFAPVDFSDWADEPLRPVLSKALDGIRSIGVQMKEVEIPDFPYGALLSSVLAGEAGSIFEEFIRSGKVDELSDQRQIAGLKSYIELPATEYLRAMRIRSQVQDAFRKLFLDVDVLVTPTRLSVASPITEPLDGGGGGFPPKSRGMSGIIPAGNLAGLPALSLPCGFAGGLPVAICLVSRPFAENQLLALGKAFQRDTDWHRQKPKM